MPNTKILLVEDNDDDVELTLHAFRSSRVANDIEVARSGEEALDVLFRPGVPPAVVLLDLQLPGISGLDVLRALRGRAETKRIPVVILTTSDAESDIAGGYDLGVNSYIRKPVGFSAFTDVVNQLGLYWLVTNTAPPV